MGSVFNKSFESADEIRTPDKTKLEIVNIDGNLVGRMTAQPGWRWSECIKPVVGGDSCQALHLGAVVAGTMHIQHEDGSEADLSPGDAYEIKPGHDAWVTSSEPFVAFEFTSKTLETFAKS